MNTHGKAGVSGLSPPEICIRPLSGAKSRAPEADEFKFTNLFLDKAHESVHSLHSLLFEPCTTHPTMCADVT